jgi:predicted membrane chloride channel (bestrophin family)
MEFVERAKMRRPSPRELFAWHGTIMKAVLCNSYIYWLSNALFLVVVVLKETGNLDFIAEPKENYLSDTNTFLSFFVIFYLGQCFSRWQTQFDSSMAVVEEVHSTAIHLASAYAGKDLGPARQIVRYMNAAMVLGFVGLSVEFDNDYFDAFARHHGLVTDEEAAILAKLDPESSGEGYRLCIKWGLQILDVTHKRNAVLSAPELASLKGRLLSMRSKIVSLGDSDLEPIPFAYFNMLSVLLIVYLPLHAVYTALIHHEEWYYSWFQVLLSNYIFIGMSELAIYLVRPYGHRRNHFALFDWMSNAISDSRKVLSDSEAWSYTPKLNPHTFVDTNHRKWQEHHHWDAKAREVTMANAFTANGSSMGGDPGGPK